MDVDVEQEVRGSHDREMISNILCNFCYFRSYNFISSILGIFKTFLVILESCYGTVSIRICLGYSYLENRFSGAIK